MMRITLRRRQPWLVLQTSVDIFCRVVDNFGDIGVTWRLARQLAAEHGAAVRLFVDDLGAFAKIAPNIELLKVQYPRAFPDIFAWKHPWNGEFEYSTHLIPPEYVRPDPAARPGQGTRCVSNVENFVYKSNSCVNRASIPRHERMLLKAHFCADIVIEAFACELPPEYIALMAARANSGNAPVWLNLEYLSAELWVETHHLLPSLHPRLQLSKHFFFPGFTDKTGGLIRERNIKQTTPALRTNARQILAFGYDTPQSVQLICAMACSANVANISIPVGALADIVANAIETVSATSSDTNIREKIRVIPFVPQPEFDALLAAHDFLLVRGEDSFVRAQFAARPFVWQIYPQAEGAHLIKLDAFLDRYCIGLAASAATALRALSHALNNERCEGDINADWQALGTHLPALQAHAIAWQRQLLGQTDLARQLMTFAEKSLKI